MYRNIQDFKEHLLGVRAASKNRQNADTLHKYLNAGRASICGAFVFAWSFSFCGTS